MTIIKQSFDDVTVPDCLVVGTEEGMVVVLDTVDFSIKYTVNLSTCPMVCGWARVMGMR